MEPAAKKEKNDLDHLFFEMKELMNQCKLLEFNELLCENFAYGTDDINKRNSMKWALLHYLCFVSEDEEDVKEESYCAIKEVMNYPKCDVNVLSSERTTPLMVAAMSKYDSAIIMEVLLDNPVVDVNIKSGSLMTASMYKIESFLEGKSTTQRDIDVINRILEMEDMEGSYLLPTWTYLLKDFSKHLNEKNYATYLTFVN